MEQQTLFDDLTIHTISIECVAERLNVSQASVHNWIKTGYLEKITQGQVSIESFQRFQNEIVGTEKLNKRANKSCLDEHDHDAVSTLIVEVLSQSNENISAGAISNLYEKELSASYKNSEGVFYTPSEICSTFFDCLSEEREHLTFCDPCCGSGNFLVAALDAGLKPENIFGFDTDETAIAIARRRIYEHCNYKTPNLNVADFLNVTISANNMLAKYDVIFTNPPWGKKLPREEKEKYASFLGHTKAVDTSALFLLASIAWIKESGYLGLLLPDSFFNVSAFKEIRETLLENQIIKFTDFGKPFKGLLTKAKSFVACIKEKSVTGEIKCMTPAYTHFRSQESFLKNPNCILNFSASPSEADVVSHMLATPHNTLSGAADWALGIVTGNNKKFVVNEQLPDHIPVHKGLDITRTGLNGPKSYIPADLTLYQQVAPRELYEAKEKLLYKFISSNLVFYHDTEQKFILNSSNLLVVRNDFPVNMKLLSEYLSCDVINWFFQRVFETHKILRSDLEKIPIYVDFLKKSSLFSEKDLLNYLGIERVGNGSYRIKR